MALEVNSVPWSETIRSGLPRRAIIASSSRARILVRQMAGEGGEAWRCPHQRPELTKTRHLARQPQERKLGDIDEVFAGDTDRQEAQALGEEPATIEVEIDAEGV